MHIKVCLLVAQCSPTISNAYRTIPEAQHQRLQPTTMSITQPLVAIKHLLQWDRADILRVILLLILHVNVNHSARPSTLAWTWGADGVQHWSLSSGQLVAKEVQLDPSLRSGNGPLELVRQAVPDKGGEVIQEEVVQLLELAGPLQQLGHMSDMMYMPVRLKGTETQQSSSLKTL